MAELSIQPKIFRSEPLPGEIEWNFSSNFVERIRQIACRILEQGGRISDQDREDIRRLNKEFLIASRNAAHGEEKKGFASPVIASVAFLISISQFAFPEDPQIQKMAELFASQIPNAGGLFTSQYQAEIMREGAIRDLRNAQIQAKTTEKQSDAGKSQEVLELFRRAMQAIEQAASAR